MRLRQSFSMSWRAIKGHRLRSTLTTLGVIIGIGAVITFVTLGASLQADIIGEVGGEEASQIYVWYGPADQPGAPGARAEPVLTDYDAEQIATYDSVAAAIPVGRVETNALTYRGETIPRGEGVTATHPAYLDEDDVAEGRLFELGEREAVVNPLLATQFETNVSVGDIVTVTRSDGTAVDVTVVGILDNSETQGPFEGFGMQPRMYVPTDPLYNKTVTSPNTGEQTRVYSLMVVRATGPEQVDAAKADTQTYLQEESDGVELGAGLSDYAFKLQTSEELLDQVRQLLDTLTGFITGIALISLIVGAIGIANIMLVSVTERTREIGIMKAVGAQNRDILTLFLTEAVVLGVIGAVLGTLVGFAGGYVATELIDLPLVYPLEWAAIAVVVGLAVGAVAGLYPAWNAARTDPIDALRYE